MLGRKIGENIRAARKAKGISLEKLAAKVRPPTSYQQLSRLEQGRMLTIDWIERIGLALDVDPMELIRGPSLSEDVDLSEQVANEIARTLALVARDGVPPEPGTVQALSLMLQELTATFLKYPQAYQNPEVARPVLELVGKRHATVAN
jgi:transcriptional regulator with XRE-family HTH domain